MPKLSIIIPTFNAVNTIEETLRTIVDQSFQDFELIETIAESRIVVTNDSFQVRKVTALGMPIVSIP